MDFGSSLKAIRIDKGLTQKQVSEAVEIPLITYQNYELNTRTLSLEVALKLAKFYKISVEKLVTYGK